MWPGGGIDRGICPDTAVMSGGFCCRESSHKSRTWVKPKTTRNSASADKPRDVFVQIQQSWPKKTRPSPYVILCQIWSFYVKMCRHKYRRTPENCAALQPPCGRDVDDPQLCQSPCVILPNLTVLYVKQYQRYWGDAPEKNDSSRPAFQGQSRSWEPTRIDRPPMTSYERSITTTMSPSRTVS